MKKERLFTPSHVANFILKKAKKDNRHITQLKLLKLVYLVYGWVLAVLDRTLFDEQFEAWKFGPVIPSLYHEFKRFGKNTITDYSIAMDEEGDLFNPFIELNAENSSVIEIMTKAWEVYSPFASYSLVTQIHEDDNPWEKHYSPEETAIIPDNEIKTYFVRKITEYVT